ncbi:MAG TPA: shikimate kinase [Fervidobacterium sp.]|nr:shikimate kinase [Fervidobacterium sp.]HPT54087.1 shikimate kinase [Fervidobacterium sp.]HPZ17764.1 shikimate kinase [Fervidobacterium sp.]HQE48953.1 shikimate kinase [Fervidobacterium sp.]HRD19755.1 shikimate kinase [Fervidobacterium sp.]
MTGLPGSGKSLIAKMLKEDFGFNIIEIEKILEIETGKDFYTLLSTYGIKEVGKMERRIVDRFEKSCDKIIVGCGAAVGYSNQGFLLIYLKIPRERFYEKIKKYIKREAAEKHYVEFHKYYSNHSQLVISTEHKMKFEISRIIADFIKKTFTYGQNT